MSYSWRVTPVSDPGFQLAGGIAPTMETASGEASRYALQYAMEQPVRYTVKQGRKNVMTCTINSVTVVPVEKIQ